MIRPLLLCLLALVASPATAAAPTYPGLPRVALVTPYGPIVIALETKRAPITAGNFLKYVDQKRFDGTGFYRAARTGGEGLIQGGINHVMLRSLPPIAHEPTTKTGLKHTDGTVSMARNDPGTAMGDFFITIGPSPALDAGPNHPGYAAFGHVVRGMDVVKRILAAPTFPGGWSRQTIGQSIRQPIAIVRAQRVR